MDCQSFAPIGLYKADAASNWLLIKCHCYEINRITKAIGVILAFNGKMMFYFN